MYGLSAMRPLRAVVLTAGVLCTLSIAERLVRASRKRSSRVPVAACVSSGSRQQSGNDSAAHVSTEDYSAFVAFFSSLLSEITLEAPELSDDYAGVVRLVLLRRNQFSVPVDTILEEVSLVCVSEARAAGASLIKCCRGDDPRLLSVRFFWECRGKALLLALASSVAALDEALDSNVSLHLSDAHAMVTAEGDLMPLLVECEHIMKAFDAHSADYDRARAEVHLRKEAVLRVYAARSLRSYRALAFYVCASSPFKMVCMGMSLGLAGIVTGLSLTGDELRRDIESLLLKGPVERSAGLADISVVSLLIAGEVIRLACVLIVEKGQQNFISISTAFHRERMKMSLYRALPLLPLAFYDRFTTDEIEEIVLYVNDLEGVDVHLQNFVVTAIRHSVDLNSKLRLVYSTDTSGGLVFPIILASAIACRCLDWCLRKVALRLKRQAPITIADVEELENISGDSSRVDAGGRFFLRGLSCMGYVHSLRPFGADSRLLSLWVQKLQTLIDKRDMGYIPHHSHEVRQFSLPSLMASLFDRVVSRLVRESINWLPAFSTAVSRVVKVLLPLVTYALVQAQQTTRAISVTPLFISEMMSAIERALDTFFDLQRIYELITANAHKAMTISRLLAEARAIEQAELTVRGAVCESLAAIDASQLSCIRVENISFAYPSRPSRLVLKDVSLTIPVVPGSIVAITGRSGCGKSTLASLFLRLYDVHSGTVSLHANINGSDRAYPLTSMPQLFSRSLFAYVPQHTVIYPGTVAQNISLEPIVGFGDTALLARIEVASRLAGCSEFIESLPERYFTSISQSNASDKSVRLSGGQAQRIGIARALYRSECPILLLDEPTSSLDLTTKTELIEMLRDLLSLSGGCGPQCIICITHDADVLSKADCVVNFGEA